MEQLEQHEYLTTNHLPYANMTMASLLNAHIANVNSERQALWLRYGTMLQANALLYGFFLTAGTLTTLQVAFAAGLGLALCMTWLVMTISSFRLFSLRLDVTSRLARSELDAISEYANPVSSRCRGLLLRRGLLGRDIPEDHVVVGVRDPRMPVVVVNIHMVRPRMRRD
jgi:hypothetical protein